MVNPGFFNGAGNASTRLAWIDNSAVAKGVFKPQENAVLLAFMLMLYEGSCERSGSCACRRMKASRHTCWTLCDVPSVESHRMNPPTEIGWARFAKYSVKCSLGGTPYFGPTQGVCTD